MSMLKGNSWRGQGKAQDDAAQQPHARQCLRVKSSTNQCLPTELLTMDFVGRLRSTTTTEVASVRAEREVRDMRGERRGTVEEKQTAPALWDMKPHSCLWLILPECGGGAGGVMLSN